MAVKLRLVRVGKKKQPTYRVVAADARAPRNGRFIELIGTYEPRQEPSVIKIDNERALYWLKEGAQPTERVEKLLRISGAWETHTGETSEAAAPAAAAKKSAKQLAREAEAAEAAAEKAAAADSSDDEASDDEASDDKVEAVAEEAAAEEEPAAVEATEEGDQ